MTVVLLNVIGMALDFHGIEEHPGYAAWYGRGMAAFTYFYYGECALKLFGMGGAYFCDGWCRLDFFLVCTSLLDQLASELLEQILPLPPAVLRVLRVLRILRILRLLKNVRGLRDLVSTLVAASPAMANISLLLALVVFIYAVLGLNMCSPQSHTRDARPPPPRAHSMLSAPQRAHCIGGATGSPISSTAR